MPHLGRWPEFEKRVREHLRDGARDPVSEHDTDRPSVLCHEAALDAVALAARAFEAWERATSAERLFERLEARTGGGR